MWSQTLQVNKHTPSVCDISKLFSLSHGKDDITRSIKSFLQITRSVYQKAGKALSVLFSKKQQQITAICDYSSQKTAHSSHCSLYDAWQVSWTEMIDYGMSHCMGTALKGLVMTIHAKRSSIFDPKGNPGWDNTADPASGNPMRMHLLWQGTLTQNYWLHVTWKILNVEPSENVRTFPFLTSFIIFLIVQGTDNVDRFISNNKHSLVSLVEE